MQHNLGTYNNLKEVWNRYPNGGGHGDYVIIDGEKLYWNELQTSWGDYEYEPEIIRPGIVYEGDIKVEGTGTFHEGIKIGDSIPGYSGALIDEFGNADYRRVNTDSLFIRDEESGNLVSLAKYIVRFKTELPPNWEEYQKLPLFGSARLLLFDGTSESRYYTTIRDVTDAIAAHIEVTGGGGGGGSSIVVIRSDDQTVAPSDSNVYSSLATLRQIDLALQFATGVFLSRLHSDTAQGHISFLKGISVEELATFLKGLESEEIATLKKGLKIPKGAKDYGIDADAMALLKHLTLEDGFQSEVFIPGIGGEGVKLRKKPATLNQWQLEIEDLIVNGRLSVNTIEVLEWKHVGAGQIFSHAGFKIDRVEELADRYRVYPEKPEMNTFQVNSQALCQQFDFTSKRYWRLVIAVAEDRSYIELSKTDAEIGSDIPEAGDSIFAYGFRGTNNALKGAIIISSYGDDGPYIHTLRGIDSYDVSGKTQIFIGNETYFRVDRFEIKSGTDWYRVPVDKGLWETGEYNYYDRVSHNGSLWLCIAQPSTIEEPSETSIAWEEQVKKGGTGKTPLRVEKFNTPGYEFYREGHEYAHTLGIKIFDGEEDITDTINIARFVWMRISENDAGDSVWNDIHTHSGASVDINLTDLSGDTSFIVQFWDASKETLLRTTKF